MARGNIGLQVADDHFNEPYITSEQYLIMAVIERAFLDIEDMQALPPNPPRAHGGKNERRSRYFQAKTYGWNAVGFLFSSDYLIELADLAGIDGNAIRRAAVSKFPGLRMGV